MKALLVAIPAAVLGSALSLTLVGQAQSTKTPSAVAYVSASRVLTESIHGRSEAGRIQARQQQLTTELRTKQQALEATRQQVATATDGSARMELQQKEIQQRTDFERSSQQAQVELQTLQRDVNADLQRRVKTALDDLMKTQNYQMVLNADAAVLWSASELDLTSAVVGRLNGQQ